KLLAHVLQCEVCTDAALSLLRIGPDQPRKKGETPDYEAILAKVEARTAETLTWIVDQGQRATDFADELTRLPDDQARQRRVQELARVEPWAVAVSLLGVANRLLRSEPERAAGFAKLAATAAE